MADTRPDPDPPLAPTPSAKQATKNDTAGRLKKISGGGPNFSPSRDPLDGIPHPNNPYKGG